MHQHQFLQRERLRWVSFDTTPGLLAELMQDKHSSSRILTNIYLQTGQVSTSWSQLGRIFHRNEIKPTQLRTPPFLEQGNRPLSRALVVVAQEQQSLSRHQPWPVPGPASQGKMLTLWLAGSPWRSRTPSPGSLGGLYVTARLPVLCVGSVLHFFLLLWAQGFGLVAGTGVAWIQTGWLMPRGVLHLQRAAGVTLSPPSHPHAQRQADG